MWFSKTGFRQSYGLRKSVGLNPRFRLNRRAKGELR